PGRRRPTTSPGRRTGRSRCSRPRWAPEPAIYPPVHGCARTMRGVPSTAAHRLKPKLPRTTKGRVALAASVAVLLLLLAWALRPDPPPALATAPAVIGDVEQTVVATGTIEAR